MFDREQIGSPYAGASVRITEIFYLVDTVLGEERHFDFICRHVRFAGVP
jgi:hypothetical protein